MDLDDVIPGPHYRICHSRVARAPLPAVWDALHRVTMSALPLGHALEGMRVLPARLSGKKPGPLAGRSFLDVTPIPVLFCERPQVLSREPLGAYIVSLSPAKTQEERDVP